MTRHNLIGGAFLNSNEIKMSINYNGVYIFYMSIIGNKFYCYYRLRVIAFAYIFRIELLLGKLKINIMRQMFIVFSLYILFD